MTKSTSNVSKVSLVHSVLLSLSLRILNTRYFLHFIELCRQMRSNDLSKTIWKLLATLGEDTNLGAIKYILHGAAFLCVVWTGAGCPCYSSSDECLIVSAF